MFAYRYLHSVFFNSPETGGTERMFFTFMLSLAHTTPSLAHEIFLLFLYHYGIFKECIIQKRAIVPYSLISKAWFGFTLNHFFVIPFLIYFAYPEAKKYLTLSCSPTDIPDVGTILLQISICIVLEDFLFYWSHRILHIPFFYKHIHKKHHQFYALTACSGIAAEYTHPIESLFGNVIPALIGPALLDMHLYATVVWLVIRMWKTCDAHSGYQFRWSPFNIGFPFNQAERHDFHHETGKGSFGSFLVVWDTVCGTDAAYLTKKKEAKKEITKAA